MSVSRLLEDLTSQMRSRIPRFGDRRFRTALWLATSSAPWDVARSLYWWVRRKRVRAWNILTSAASAHGDYYGRAIAEYEKQIALRFDREPYVKTKLPLTFIVSSAASGRDLAVQSTVQNIREVFGQNVPVIVTDRIKADGQHSELPGLSDVLANIPADCSQWILIMGAGDRLAPQAARLLGDAVTKVGEAEIIYWDEDVVAGQRRQDQWLKPSWDSLLFLSRDFLSGCSICRADALARAVQTLSGAGIATDEIDALSIALAVGGGSPPAHLPIVLTHRSKMPIQSLAHRQEWLDKLWPEEVTLSDGANPYFAQIAFADPVKWPTISLIIPTRDRADLMRNCLDGLAMLTYGGSIELVIVDNGSRDADAIQLLSSLACRKNVKVIRDDGAFNFSRLINRGAQLSTGEFLCLLNNDVEPIDGQWLTEMVRFAARAGAGAVGALLLYPDGSVQHAGVTVGIGGAAGHGQRSVSPDDLHNFAWHGVSRSVSAVTAACLVVSKASYMNVSGLDEENFPVAFNDVDFCLKLTRAGLTNVYAANARLIHHESLSRGSDLEPTKRRRFERELKSLQSKWNTDEIVDQYHHPALIRTGEQCVTAL